MRSIFFRGGRPQLTALILVSFLFISSCTTPDLSVQSIEVNQAIQTSTNTVTLVAQRSTVVRVTVGTGGGSVSNVTGRLKVSVNGIEITPAAGIAPIAPLNAVASPDRNNENHTLNFELPSPTNITASNDVDFSVTLDPATGETNTANNSGAAENLTFVNRTTPSLFFTRINYTPSGLGLPNIADVQAGRGDVFVRGIFPVNDGDPNLYRQGLFPTLNYSDDPNGNGSVDDNTEKDNILSLLASCRQLIVDNGLGAANNTFLYGWVAGNPILSNGWGQINGFNAFGNTQDIRFQRTFAHELTHNFGLNHNSRTLNPEVGWDVASRLPANPAGNNVTGRVKPSTLNDIMVAGILTTQAWVDVTTYNFFLGSSIVGGSDATGGDRFKPQQRIAVIQGIFSPLGDSLLYLEPVFRFPWLSQQGITRLQDNPFTVRITDNAGSVSNIPFNALVGDDKDNNKIVQGFFEVMVPIAPNREIISLQIFSNKDSNRVLGEFKRSAPPRIRIVSPLAGSNLGNKTTVKWEVNDPDTPLGDLLFQVAYSPNGGRNWVPLGVDIKGTDFTFNSNEIQASQENGIIRVFVSDGLNTAFADVTKLVTT
ncbi:MAG: hypothetical protein M3352_07305, partial [Bacteroidota bacterium]|nr:hypothetical protein [Bacteroidota bacterium]